ncbi:MAG: hypothetical protein RR835_05440 [Peptostreptococcaceae bacterium]
MPKSFESETYNSIDRREYNEYLERVKCLYPHNTKRRYEYAKKIMPGQIYLYYLVDELQEATMASAYSYGDYKKIDTVTFSTSAIETLLRAMYFMIDHMNDGLPEHNYGYIKTKSSTFFDELREAIEENIKILEEA